MLFVWRGSGITVPIFTFISGFIMSYWFDDTRLGNYPFLGWTLLWAGIILTLQGVGVWGGGKPDPETGQIHLRKGHDFFFIPVVFWGIGYIGLSIWLLNKEVDERYTAPEPTEVSAYSISDSMLVNIYNPYLDSMDITITDLKTKVEIISATIPGDYTNYKTFACGPYYVEIDQLERTDRMRVHGVQRESFNEYKELWYVLGGAVDLVLVEVTDICDSTVTRAEIEAVDWMSKVKEKYNGKQMVEPFVKYDIKKKPIIYGVGSELPLSHKKRERIYTLVPVDSRNRFNEEELEAWILSIIQE